MSVEVNICISEIPFIQSAIKEANTEVGKLCAEANKPSQGFEIDDSFCDWGFVPTASIVGIVDDAACKLGAFGTQNYKIAVKYICEEITESFK